MLCPAGSDGGAPRKVSPLVPVKRFARRSLIRSHQSKGDLRPFCYSSFPERKNRRTRLIDMSFRSQELDRARNC